MNILKLARGIAFSTAILAGLLTVGMIVFTDYAIERGLNEYNLLGGLFIFFMSALYALAVDAKIKEEATDVESVKKVHQTTLNQCIWMMVLLLIGAILFFVL